jgi:HKD family nuclease
VGDGMKYEVERVFCEDEKMVTLLQDRLESGWKFLFAVSDFKFESTGKTFVNSDDQLAQDFVQVFGFHTYWCKEDKNV